MTPEELKNFIQTHRHTGLESAKIDYNDLINLPGSATATGGNKSVLLANANADYLLITDANQTGLDLATTFTLEAWVKANSLISDQVIMSKNNGTLNYAYGLRVSSAGKLILFVTDDGTAISAHAVNYTTSAQQIFVGVWTHVAVTFDIAGPTCIFYVNGVLVTNSSDGGTVAGTIFNNATPFMLGMDLSGGSPNVGFNGYLDDCRVWSVVRTVTEIANNYQAELLGSETNLQGYWKLNGNASDMTANANSLTVANTPTYSNQSGL